MIPKIHKEFISNLTEVLKKDLRFIGLTIGGSYLTNEMDEYSDVDLILVVDPKFYEEVMEKRSEVAEKFGNLLSAFTGEHVGEPRLLICLYGPLALHVDLKFVTQDEAEILKNTITEYNPLSCIKSLEILIDLYHSLRNELATDKFRNKTEAEKCAVEYLQSIKRKKEINTIVVKKA